jgi:hypothetical protein|tara:strand:+ start:1117 stop:1365 length:249 start_codon:yes stop_codon:yes gene_type:complete
MELISCKLCNKNIEKKAFDCMYCQAVLKTPKRNKSGKIAVFLFFTVNFLYLIVLNTEINTLITVTLNFFLLLFVLLTRPKKY